MSEWFNDYVLDIIFISDNVWPIGKFSEQYNLIRRKSFSWKRLYLENIGVCLSMLALLYNFITLLMANKLINILQPSLSEKIRLSTTVFKEQINK